MLTPISLLNGNPKASAKIQMELMSMSRTNMDSLKEEEKRATINACEIYDFVIQSLPILVGKMKNMQAVQIISHFLCTPIFYIAMFSSIHVQLLAFFDRQTWCYGIYPPSSKKSSNCTPDSRRISR